MSDTATKASQNGAARELRGSPDGGIELAPPPKAAPPSVIERTYGLTDAEYSILLKTTCIDAPREMAGFFMIFCRRRNLDPFAKHVYLWKQKEDGQDKWQIVGGIDGFRVIGSRNPYFRGISKPVWEYVLDENGQPATFSADASKYGAIAGKRIPLSCEVIVYRAISTLAERGIEGRDHWMPFYGIARFDEFVKRDYQTKKIKGNWENQPEHQLSIRAEAMAYRRAFPEDVGSIYLDEELSDQGTEVKRVDPVDPEQPKGPRSRAAQAADDFERRRQANAAATETIEQRAEVDLTRLSADERRAYLLALTHELGLDENGLIEIERSYEGGELSVERCQEIVQRLYDAARDEADREDGIPPDFAAMNAEQLAAYVKEAAQATRLSDNLLRVVLRAHAKDGLTATNIEAVLAEIRKRGAGA